MDAIQTTALAIKAMAVFSRAEAAHVKIHGKKFESVMQFLTFMDEAVKLYAESKFATRQ